MYTITVLLQGRAGCRGGFLRHKRHIHHHFSWPAKSPGSNFRGLSGRWTWRILEDQMGKTHDFFHTRVGYHRRFQAESFTLLNTPGRHRKPPSWNSTCPITCDVPNSCWSRWRRGELQNQVLFVCAIKISTMRCSAPMYSEWPNIAQVRLWSACRVLLLSFILSNLGCSKGLRLEPHDQLLAILESVAVEKTVIITQTSCGYLDFAENWITHAEGIGIKNYLTVVDDDVSFEYLNARFPGHIVSVDIFAPGAINFNMPLLDFGSKSFNKMSCDRLIYQRKVLERGFSMLWIDMDTVLFEDPVSVMPGGFEFIAADDILHDDVSEQKTGNICGCLIFFRPTRNARDFLHQWYEKCTLDELPDQPALNSLWHETDWKQRLHWYIMPRQLFPSGKLEPKIDNTPETSYPYKSKMFPVFIHANYRVGKDKKRLFLKERSAWKISEEQEYPTCDSASSQAWFCAYVISRRFDLQCIGGLVKNNVVILL